MSARLTFAIDALTVMGAPVTVTNLKFILGQLDRDSGQQGQTTDQTGWNPGNISHDVPGVPDIGRNVANTRRYPTYAQGVAAYAGQYHEPFLRPVLNDLIGNASIEKLSQDFIATGYASAGYNVGSFVGSKSVAQLDGYLRDANGNVVQDVQPLNAAAVQHAKLLGINIGGALGPITGLGNLSGSSTGLAGGLAGMANFFGALMSWDTWKRILLVIAGAGLVGLGFVLIKDDTFTQVGKDIAAVAPLAA